MISDIRAARKGRRPIVIPFMHWGWENRHTPSLRQRMLARRMIDAGASLVVGGHPHVIQDAELYRGRLIVYSPATSSSTASTCRGAPGLAAAARGRPARPQGLADPPGADRRRRHAGTGERRRDACGRRGRGVIDDCRNP